jgi:hypothetical protein
VLSRKTSEVTSPEVTSPSFLTKIRPPKKYKKIQRFVRYNFLCSPSNFVVSVSLSVDLFDTEAEHSQKIVRTKRLFSSNSPHSLRVTCPPWLVFHPAESCLLRGRTQPIKHSKPIEVATQTHRHTPTHTDTDTQTHTHTHTGLSICALIKTFVL